MEYRKLISFGKSSYVVSLPKHWLRQKGLSKGDNVSIDVNDTNLIIHPSEQVEEQTNEQAIDATGLNSEVIKQRIIDSYINNADRVTIRGDWQSIRETIYRATDLLAAMEITEEAGNRLTLQSFLNIDDVELPKLFRKTDHIINDMFKHLSDVTEEDKISAASISDDITERDQSVNRMCFLLLRTINAKLKTLTNAQNADMPGLWGRTFLLEEVGDEIKRIARLLVNVEEPEPVLDVLETVYDKYRHCMDAYFSDDKDLAYEIAEEREATMKQCSTLRDDRDAPLFISLTDRLKQLVAKIYSINRISY